ncbi:HD domain-containing protein [Alteromonas sp. KUL49]|uniref:HD domain-containing protein n=1 Tax=Alteromonas sp. KUL49 TaxID=2480798 RepID=UPI00102F0F92|nr:HD domain-containing protein [Alteromonas sp. KUL49]TAP38961.1 HD domain-containing protein [Alteromonas sp. KUL49]GEA12401.1 phosphohydrolase [Alteromonas sp. KUL49]
MSFSPSDFSAFISELDHLKRVKRQIRLPFDDNRKENSAEHSWHVALTASTLARFAHEPIDISRVIQMILLHDIVEIDAGDLFAFDTSNQHEEQARKELDAAKRIFGLLPTDIGSRYLALWIEFEEANTPDAQFAKSMDRILPVFQNMRSEGGSWRAHGITRIQIEKRNVLLKTSAPKLWDYLQEQLTYAQTQGWLS